MRTVLELDYFFFTLKIVLGYAAVPYWAGLGQTNCSTHVGYWVNFTAEVLV